MEVNITVKDLAMKSKKKKKKKKLASSRWQRVWIATY